MAKCSLLWIELKWFGTHRNTNLTHIGKLSGVSNQVDQDLMESGRIADNVARAPDYMIDFDVSAPHFVLKQAN